MAPIVAPVSLESMAPEIVSEIMVAAMEECSWRAVFPLCSTSHYLREVALGTSALWMNVVATCKLHQSTEHSPHVTKRDMEFLEWWYQKANKRNELVLDFDFKLVRRGGRTDWTPLSGRALRTILNLLTHARFLRTGSAALSILTGVFLQDIHKSPEEDFSDISPPWAPAPFPFLQSILIENTYGEGRLWAYERQLWNVLTVFEMPALRKCVVGSLVLWNPYDMPGYPDGSKSSFEEMWSRLTHVHCAFQGTRTLWREFIGGMRSVISARIDLELVEADDMQVQPAGGISVADRTLVNLNELWLKIDCQLEVYDVGSVLDGLSLPAVRTLVIDASRASLGCLHRILGATRMVERIRLSAMFPLLDLNVNHVEFHATNDRLVNHAPNLRQLTIDIPHIRQFEDSFRGYVDGMRDSCWLRGRWRNAPLRVEFYQPGEVLSMYGVIEDLKDYLESPVVPTVGDLGQVDIAFREANKRRVDILRAQEGVPDWNLWYDFGEQFN